MFNDFDIDNLHVIAIPTGRSRFEPSEVNARHQRACDLFLESVKRVAKTVGSVSDHVILRAQLADGTIAAAGAEVSAVGKDFINGLKSEEHLAAALGSYEAVWVTALEVAATREREETASRLV